MTRHARRLGIWLLFAVLLTAPASLQPAAWLIGDPRIDVWNHAWGYWFVSHSLAEGSLPFHTELVGGPAGGVLWFIDTPGALLTLPLSGLFGPAVAYNLALIARIALSGFAAQGLCEAITSRGAHGWLAGAAYATTPFLLCELANGISEVCATQWLAFTLWAAVRAVDSPRWRDWALLGLAQGWTSVTTFYYGLTSGAMLLLFFGGTWAWRAWRERSIGPLSPAQLAPRALLAVATALALTLPHWLAFRASLAAPDALIMRDAGMNLQLMAHNAVDPRVFVTPGDFQSVDLAADYDEPFVHTGYLRWSLVLLALWGQWVDRRLRGWGGLALASAVMGLGPFLWWGGDWVRVGGMMLSLPFEWIRQLMPQVAITHPLRLSLGAQLGVAVVAGGGARALIGRLEEGPKRTAALGGVAALVVAEGLFASAARWPLPRSSADIPAVYQEVEGGMVLDLPVELGRGMETSRYFWFQTAHGQPIPYTPDIRVGSVRDRVLFREVAQPGETARDPTTEQPQGLSPQGAAHLRETYGLIVLHEELAQRAGLEEAWRDTLTEALGPPEARDGLLVWRPQEAR